MLDVLLKKEPAFRVADLAISGGDLIALGMESGPAVGTVLDEALKQVMAGTLPNDREALLAYVRDKGMKP